MCPHARLKRVTGAIVGLVMLAGFPVHTESVPDPQETVRPAADVPPVRVGGSVPSPEKVRHVDPIYPPAALIDRIQGLVVVEAIVDADGQVTEARVLRGHPSLAEAAIDAVRQWQYEPTVFNGVPVSLLMTVTVNFALRSPGGPESLGRAGTGGGLPIAPAHDLTGEWSGDDGRVYRVRTVGNEIFWFGDGGEAQPNVFHGDLRSPTEYTGRWADTPPGDGRRAGVMTIRVLNPNLFEATTSTDAFPSRRWVRLPDEDAP